MFLLSHPPGNTFATSSTRRKQEKSESDSSGSSYFDAEFWQEW